MSATGWVNTGASIFSALGTVGAFTVGFTLLRREHKREEEHAEEQRRAQVSMVNAWVEMQRNAQGEVGLYFHVHNASEMPIYEVSLPVSSRTGESSTGEFLGLVQPGRTTRIAASQEWLASYFAPEPVQVEFLDSSGWAWSRDERGLLVRSLERLDAIRGEENVLEKMS